MDERDDADESYYYSLTSLEWLRDRYADQIERFEYADYEDEIYLDTIVIKESLRGQGYGTKFMVDLCKFADDNRKAISLVPSNSLGTSIFILEKFYKRFGFAYGKEEMYDDHLMIREYHGRSGLKTKNGTKQK